MNSKFGNYRTILLSLDLGFGLTDRQEKWLLNWISNHMQDSEIEKAAHIAYQYDAKDDLVEKIRQLQ